MKPDRVRCTMLDGEEVDGDLVYWNSLHGYCVVCVEGEDWKLWFSNIRCGVLVRYGIHQGQWEDIHERARSTGWCED